METKRTASFRVAWCRTARGVTQCQLIGVSVPSARETGFTIGFKLFSNGDQPGNRGWWNADCAYSHLLGVGDTCTRENALDVMRTPIEHANPATCFLHAQAFLAQTSLAQDLRETDRVKIVCSRSTAVSAKVRPVPTR